MSGPDAPGAVGPPVADVRRRARPSLRMVRRVVGLVLLSSGLGALAGVVWWWVVDLPSYVVDETGRATITERGLTRVIAPDAWFVVIGLIVGVALGYLGWRLLRDLGWPLALLVTGSALVAALLCWWVGSRLGPGDFTTRLADAQPGDLVPIALTLRAQVTLVVWPFAAVIPILLGASLGRDDEEPTPIFRRRSGDGG